MHPPDLIGYRVLGRHGELGTVVTVHADVQARSSSTTVLLVRGGTRNLLLFHLPLERVSGIFPDVQTAVSDVDVADFGARLSDDGTVDLFLER